jgi:NADH:ubiquinone reductase (H+-translocating)
MSTGRHQVVVVGGGFGGIRVARALARSDADITIVDRTNHHLFLPLLYQVAAGILPDGLIAPALRSVVRKQANARVVLAEVQQLDLDGQVVHALAPDGGKLALPYDSLVVAAGCTDAYPAVLATFAPKLQRYTRRRLQKMGVEVWLNTTARYELTHDTATDTSEV